MGAGIDDEEATDDWLSLSSFLTKSHYFFLNQLLCIHFLSSIFDLKSQRIQTINKLVINLI